MGQAEAGVQGLGVEVTESEVAALIQVVLQAEGEMALGGLAEEMGLPHRQFGMGLGLLILEGHARIRRSPEGFVVRLSIPETIQTTWSSRKGGKGRADLRVSMSVLREGF